LMFLALLGQRMWVSVKSGGVKWRLKWCVQLWAKLKPQIGH
jgi:hypothetical protein